MEQTGDNPYDSPRTWHRSESSSIPGIGAPITVVVAVTAVFGTITVFLLLLILILVLDALQLQTELHPSSRATVTFLLLPTSILWLGAVAAMAWAIRWSVKRIRQATCKFNVVR